jgi:hypothetical protein
LKLFLSPRQDLNLNFSLRRGVLYPVKLRGVLFCFNCDRLY